MNRTPRTVGLLMAVALALAASTAGPAAATEPAAATAAPPLDGSARSFWHVDPVEPAPDGDAVAFTSAVSPTDAWAVGGQTAEHWDGTAWTIVPTPVPPGAPGDNFEFGAVDARATDDVWVLVQQFTPDFANKAVFAEHWNGTSWLITPFPALNRDAQPFATGITAIASDDVWVAGTYSPALNDGCVRQLFEHWNGLRWTQVRVPVTTQNCLYFPASVSGSSGTDVWAVGSDASSNTGAQFGIIEHWNGATWSTVPAPQPTQFGNVLTDVQALSPTDAWAVGSAYHASFCDQQTLVEHWDGTAWTIVPSPNSNPEPNIGDLLFAVTALDTADVWAVGRSDNARNGLSRPLVEHWDGTAWRIVPSPNPGNDSVALDVTSAAPRTVFISGPRQPVVTRGTPRQSAILRTTHG